MNDWAKWLLAVAVLAVGLVLVAPNSADAAWVTYGYPGYYYGAPYTTYYAPGYAAPGYAAPGYSYYSAPGYTAYAPPVTVAPGYYYGPRYWYPRVYRYGWRW